MNLKVFLFLPLKLYSLVIILFLKIWKTSLWNVYKWIPCFYLLPSLAGSTDTSSSLDITVEFLHVVLAHRQLKIQLYYRCCAVVIYCLDSKDRKVTVYVHYWLVESLDMVRAGRGLTVCDLWRLQRLPVWLSDAFLRVLDRLCGMSLTYNLFLSSCRYGADVDVNPHLTPDTQTLFTRRLTSLVVCPLYISAAYHNLQCFRLLLKAGANPDFNCNGPVNTQKFYRGSPGCVMDAVLRHGCEAAFVSLLVDFGANLNLVKWESLGPEATGRRKMDPEALQVFKEARSKYK